MEPDKAFFADARTMANTAQPQEEQARDHALVVFCPSVESLAPLAEILATMLHAGDVLLLHGELGAGKTTLTQWLAQALGVDESQYVASPSFAQIGRAHV